nr:ATP-binding cassette domain-containing protein [Saccharopolyspora hordei]
MPTQITARNISKSFHGRPVLDDVTCSLAVGERTGIVGENGSGKTTLLRLLAGQERPDAGEVAVQADGGVGHVAQDEELPPERTVQDVIDRALGELRALEQRLRDLEAAMADGDESVVAEYGELTTAFEARGGYDADARVERALHGLGLGLVDRDRAVGGLSGGEQARLRLAALLAAGPEVLLLDEPTNHLDDDALTWLEEHLRTRRGTTVAVSHDRVFLERVATTCWRSTPTGTASSATAAATPGSARRRQPRGSGGRRPTRSGRPRPSGSARWSRPRRARSPRAGRCGTATRWPTTGRAVACSGRWRAGSATPRSGCAGCWPSRCRRHRNRCASPPPRRRGARRAWSSTPPASRSPDGSPRRASRSRRATAC